MSFTVRQGLEALPDQIRQSIPQEMRDLNQWILWEELPNPLGEKPLKVPLSLHTLNKIDPTQLKFCGTFEAVAASYLKNIGSRPKIGIGFSLQADLAPLVAIDLDGMSWNDAVAWFNKEGLPPTYAELSPSGKGYHAFYLYDKAADTPSRRTDDFEAYTHKRFITMTGNAVNAVPFTYVNGEMDEFFMRHKAATPLGFSANLKELQKPETRTDAEILAAIKASKHGAEFATIYENTYDRSKYNNNQSSADQAFTNILQFFSMNVNQISRIWLDSPFGKNRGGSGPDKLQRRDYVLRTIGNSFDRTLPSMSGTLVSQLAAYNEKLKAERLEANKLPVPATPAQVEEPEPEPEPSSPLAPITPPPGLVGDIAKIALESQFQNTPEYAITSALAYIAGACGQTHFVKNQTPAVYVLAMGNSGTGKESISRVHDFITEEMKAEYPNLTHSMDYFEGMMDIVSVKGLVNHLTKHRSCVSIIGEGTMWLNNLVHSREGTNQYNIYRMVLDLYGKGPKSVLKGSTYAQAQDSTKSLKGPALSIVLEGVPHHFYDKLDERMIDSGLMPRFVPIEYSGGVVPSNYKATEYSIPKPMLDKLHKFFTFTTTAVNQLAVQSMIMPNLPVDVRLMPEAEKMYRAHTEENKQFCHANNENGIGSLYNRYVVNTLKIAALVAIGIDWEHPVICPACYAWARSLVHRGLAPIEKRIREGSIGENDTAAIAEVRKSIDVWRNQKMKIDPRYGALKGTNVIPHGFFMQTAGRRTIFKANRNGSSNYLRIILTALVMAGELSDYDAANDYSYSGKCYKIV